MRNFILLLLGLFLSFPLTSVQANNILIQTESYQVPTVTQKGRAVKGIITLYMTFEDKKNVIKFCNHLPQVREAIFVTFRKNPIRYVNRKYLLDGASENVFKRFKSTFPDNGIVKIVVVSGIKKRAEGSTPIPIPGVNSKCTPISQKPKFVIVAEEKNAPTTVIKKQASKFDGQVPEGFVNPYQAQPVPKIAAEPEAKKIGLPESQDPTSLASDKISASANLKQDTVPANSKPSCTSNLSNFWNAGEYVISGQKYWLKRVFTIDRNNDSIIDDVGFDLVRHDGQENLNLYYVGEDGRSNIKLAPSLALPGRSTLAQFCPGDLKFKQPLQGGGSEKIQKGEETKPSLADTASVSKSSPKDKEGGLGGLVAIVIVAALVAMGLAGFIYIKVRKSAKQSRIDNRMSENKVAEGLHPSGPKFSPGASSGTNGPLSEKDKKRERRIKAQNRKKEKENE